MISALWCASYFGRRPLRISIASSTLGASTFTCWKRRSSAASFSMYLRYSLSVVAPTHCISPRESAGLMMLRGVHRAFGRTGADDGVQLVDEKDDVLGAADFVHDGLDALLELAAVFRARDHQGEVERDDLLVAQKFRHIARGDFLREAFRDGGLAHAGFAEEHGIVLGAAAENLDDALDFVLAADDRVDLAFAGEFGEVAAKGLQRGRLDVALLLGLLAGPPPAPGSCSDSGRGEIRIEFLEDFVAGALDVDFEILEHARGHAVAFAQQAEQDVLGADVGMIERLGFLAGEREDFLHARRVGDIADHLGLGAGADLLLHFHADGFEVEPHLLQHVDGDALAQLDQAEQQMLGADVIVVEPVGFLAGQGQDLLGARSKVIHHLAFRCFRLGRAQGFGLISGSGNCLSFSRIIPARNASRSSAASFCCEVLLQMRRLGLR